ncbi:MAG TPA: septum site-determining protein Ssd [Cellulomonas sp.]
MRDELPWSGSSASAAASGGIVIGVVGARGGVGASTLAALVASRSSRRTATVLVDLDEAAGGVDVLVGLEEEPGARWPDLSHARGDVDGRDIVALLPRWGRVAVLSADRSRPGPVDPSAARDVVAALAQASGCVVVDLGRSATLAGHPVVGLCDRVVLVAGRDLRSVAGALALGAALGQGRAGLVVRGPAPGGLGATELAEAVGLPVVWAGRADRAVARAGEQGVLPPRGPAGRAAAAILANVP